MLSSDEETRTADGVQSPATKPQDRIRDPFLLAGHPSSGPDADPSLQGGVKETSLEPTADLGRSRRQVTPITTTVRVLACPRVSSHPTWFPFRVSC